MQTQHHDAALISPLLLELHDRLLDIRGPFHTGLWHGQNMSPSLVDGHMTFCTDAGLDQLSVPVDLAISFLEMHWFENLPGYLNFIHSKLSDNGLFLGVMWGGETLYELKDALICTEAMLWGSGSVRAAPMVSAHDMAALMQKSPFFAPVVDVIPLTATYNCLNDLVRDLRMMGETEALMTRNPRYCGQEFWQHVEGFLASQHKVSETEERFQITFQALFILGWKTPPRSA